MKQFLNSCRLLIVFSAAILLGLAGCKKSDDNTGLNPNVRNDGTISATVAGNSWSAKSVYAVDSSGMIVIVGASTTTTNNYPVILLAFPDNTAEGANVSFNIAQYSMLQYIEDASNAYWAEPAFGGSGNVTISKFNKSTKRVEGSFTATLKNANAGGASKALSAGQFAINYH